MKNISIFIFINNHSREFFHNLNKSLQVEEL